METLKHKIIKARYYKKTAHSYGNAFILSFDSTSDYYKPTTPTAVAVVVRFA